MPVFRVASRRWRPSGSAARQRRAQPVREFFLGNTEVGGHGRDERRPNEPLGEVTQQGGERGEGSKFLFGWSMCASREDLVEEVKGEWLRGGEKRLKPSSALKGQSPLNSLALFFSFTCRETGATRSVTSSTLSMNGL